MAHQSLRGQQHNRHKSITPSADTLAAAASNSVAPSAQSASAPPSSSVHALGRMTILPTATVSGAAPASSVAPVSRRAWNKKKAPAAKASPAVGAPAVAEGVSRSNSRQDVVQRSLAQVLAQGARRTFGTGKMQKARNPSKLDANSDEGKRFLGQVESNNALFEAEGQSIDEKAAIKAELKRRERLINVEMGKAKPDQRRIRELMHLSDKEKRFEKGQHDVVSSVPLAQDEQAFLDKNDEESQALSYGGLGAKTAGGVSGFSGSVAGGSKTLAQKLNPGDKATIGETSGKGDSQKVVSVGNAEKGSEVLGTVTAIADSAGTVLDLVKQAKALKKGNDAQKNEAAHRMVDAVIGVGKNVLTLGHQGSKMAAAFGGADMANNLGGGVIPGFGLAISIVAFLQHGKDLILQGYRAAKDVSLYFDAKKSNSKNKALYMASLGHLSGRNIQLVASSAVNLVVDALKIAGGAASLSGVGASVGMPLSAAATALGAANMFAHTMADSYQAAKVHENRNQFSGAKSLGNKDEMSGAAKNLLALDPKQAAQTLVARARKHVGRDPLAVAAGKGEGAKLAVRAMSTYGITEKMLKDKSISDADLRKLILFKVQEKEDPQTLADQAVELAGKAKDGYKKVKEIGGKPTRTALLMAIKNVLNYKGKKERGAGWKFKQHFGGESAPEMEKAIVTLSKELTPPQKLEVTAIIGATSTEYKLWQALLSP